jgi:hypothetical protein
MKERVITHWEDVSVVRVDSQVLLITPSGQRTQLYID